MSSGAAYQKFNPDDEIGFGSRDQWQGTAQARMDDGGVRGRTRKAKATADADLTLLGLSAVPANRRDLDLAFRLKARGERGKQNGLHPDAGGSHAAFLNLTAAYERLGRRVKG
jgi:hypothetical protein